MIHRKLHSTRRGFTLIELLVAAALSVLTMAIISLAFQQATATMSQLKSVSDLASRLRIAENLLRQDLEAAHFDGPDVDSLADSPARMKLSDLRYDKIGAAGFNVKPPIGGYFNLTQGADLAVEGRDNDGISSTRATNHTLKFTVIRSGNSAAELFTNPAGIQSRHAEVFWKLSDGPTSNANAVPTFTLLRYVRVLQDPRVPATNGFPTLQSVMPIPPPLPTPPNRLTVLATPGTLPADAQDAIVITNVVSFEVKPTWEGGTAAPRQMASVTNGIINGDFPFDTMVPLAASPVFDSTPPTPTDVNTVPGTQRIRINAVKVKIRLYDPKTKLTRQSSFIIKL